MNFSIEILGFLHTSSSFNQLESTTKAGNLYKNTVTELHRDDCKETGFFVLWEFSILLLHAYSKTFKLKDPNYGYTAFLFFYFN